MNTRNDKKVIIATLCAIVIGMVVGYAALNQLLSINGTSQISGDFNIQITSIEENTMTNSKTISTGGLGTTTANFTVDLEKPGSSAIYNVTVENKGTIDAILTGINGIDEANAASPTDIKFSIQDLTLDEELLSKATKTFQVKVEWLGTSTSVPETNKTLNLKLNYEQKAELSGTDNPVSITYKINELLETSTTYEYNGGRYLSDAQVSNYVWFDGFMWRIMGINADGTVKMITEENITTIPWGAENTSKQYDTSYINDWLNNYFYPKLKDKNLLINTTWCSEFTSDSSSARTTCTNNLSTDPKAVGLLTLDEYNLASGTSNYLNNTQTFWTLTPGEPDAAWGISNNSTNQYMLAAISGVRPVIMITSGTIITRGNGTITDPYMIENKTSDATGTLKDNSHVGEYVTYAGRNYRVVETSTVGTKLILDGYYDADNNGTIDTSDKFKYNENTTDGGCTLCSKINEKTFVNWISNNNSVDASKLVSTTWYRGDNWGNSSTSLDYKVNLTSTSNPYTGKVGLIRVGEMLSGVSETILSKNHTVANNFNNSKAYWTSTSYSVSDAFYISSNGSSRSAAATKTYSVLPVIMISPSTAITSGNGTPNSPYQI